jgi:hypothetical protein
MIQEIIRNSYVMTCPHNDMVMVLIDIFTHLNKLGKLPNDFKPFAKEVLDIISERCQNKDMIDTYKLFILNKVEVAYNVAKRVETVQSDMADDVLDIPIEEFEDAYTDHEFLKELAGNNE